MKIKGCVFVTLLSDTKDWRSVRVMKVMKNPMLSVNQAVEFRRGSEEL